MKTVSYVSDIEFGTILRSSTLVHSILHAYFVDKVLYPQKDRESMVNVAFDAVKSLMIARDDYTDGQFAVIDLDYVELYTSLQFRTFLHNLKQNVLDAENTL